VLVGVQSVAGVLNQISARRTRSVTVYSIGQGILLANAEAHTTERALAHSEDRRVGRARPALRQQLGNRFRHRDSQEAAGLSQVEPEATDKLAPEHYAVITRRVHFFPCASGEPTNLQLQPKMLDTFWVGEASWVYFLTPLHPACTSRRCHPPFKSGERTR